MMPVFILFLGGCANKEEPRADSAELTYESFEPVSEETTNKQYVNTIKWGVSKSPHSPIC